MSNHEWNELSSMNHRRKSEDFYRKPEPNGLWLFTNRPEFVFSYHSDIEGESVEVSSEHTKNDFEWKLRLYFHRSRNKSHENFHGYYREAQFEATKISDETLELKSPSVTCGIF